VGTRAQMLMSDSVLTWDGLSRLASPLMLPNQPWLATKLPSTQFLFPFLAQMGLTTV
jgi:hypothetical protein